MRKFIYIGLLTALSISEVLAAEIKIGQDNNTSTALSIYTQNMAMVRQEQRVSLPQGVSQLAFEGVAEQMQPQTTLLEAGGVQVLEKNYEYNLLNQDNLLNQYIGKEVKTVMVNPTTGANVFDKAVLLNNTYGTPLLQFAYGIEANFPGRVVFDKIPQDLRVKPTLVAKVDSDKAEVKELNLNYLTQGLSWSANYVAEIADEKSMNLQAWVDISNQSGADYKVAQVTLISGDVKTSAPAPMPRPMMMMAKGANFDGAAMESAPRIPAQAIGGYYSYVLPQKVDVMNKQNKQVSLWDLQAIGFAKQYKITSPLNPNYNKNFEREHANIVYKLTNSKAQQLGLPMPAGNVRFYEKDAQGTLQFMGEAELPRLAVDESAELAIGKSFDLYAQGKIVEVSKIADKITEVEYKINFFNASLEEATLLWEQKVSGEFKLVSENSASKKDDAGVLQWLIKVPAQSNGSLDYKLRLTTN